MNVINCNDASETERNSGMHLGMLIRAPATKFDTRSPCSDMYYTYTTYWADIPIKACASAELAIPEADKI